MRASDASVLPVPTFIFCAYLDWSALAVLPTIYCYNAEHQNGSTEGQTRKHRARTRVHENVFDRRVGVQMLRLRRKLEGDPSAPNIAAAGVRGCAAAGVRREGGQQSIFALRKRDRGAVGSVQLRCADLRILSPAGERQVSHKPSSAMSRGSACAIA
jgi:hypothetical protein